LQARIGLVRPNAPRLIQRAVLASAVAWVPLLVMAFIDRPVDATAPVTFFKDLAVHVRFLIVVPLLILAEASIGPRTQMVIAEFVASGIVGENEAARFHAVLRRAKRLLDSKWAEAILLVAVYVFLWFVAKRVAIDDAAFWYEDIVERRLTPAGWWYAFVSTPIVVFLFTRWFWRYLVWAWLLRKIARLDLRISGAHPDRMGGLGFVNVAHSSFSKISLAASCVISAAAATRILHEGVALKSYQSMLIGFVVLSITVGLVPLFAFLRPLLRVKRRGIMTYGRFGMSYVQAFEKKWLGEAAPKEPALGSGDIQSLADLGGSYERLDNMSVVPFDRRTVIGFAFAAAAPMLPLLLSVISLREIVSLLFKAMM
jgi:hypothetical protein